MFWRATEELHVRYVTAVVHGSLHHTYDVIIAHHVNSKISRSPAEMNWPGEYCTSVLSVWRKHIRFVIRCTLLFFRTAYVVVFFLLWILSVGFSCTPSFSFWTGRSRNPRRYGQHCRFCLFFKTWEIHVLCIVYQLAPSLVLIRRRSRNNA